jgi:DNA-binding NarL/FixJ family response regulator
METVNVAVLATDPVTREGAIARLSAYREEISLSPGQPPNVLVVLTAEVTEQILAHVERIGRSVPDGPVRVVLVADEFREQLVLRAVTAGLVSVLHRPRSSFDQIVKAVLAAHTGRAQLPGSLVRTLIDHVRSIQQHVLAPRDLTASGLAGREVEVLRLLSDGLDSAEVAAKLNYSERTVKNIVHGIVTRHKLRNRTHAVAYAFRAGVL